LEVRGDWTSPFHTFLFPHLNFFVSCAATPPMKAGHRSRWRGPAAPKVEMSSHRSSVVQTRPTGEMERTSSTTATPSLSRLDHRHLSATSETPPEMFVYRG
jgi:hypothetical protein